MIHFFYELPFSLPNDEEDFQRWIQLIIASERKKEGDINYIFCNDEYLHKINVDYLQHDTLTDIITFDMVRTTYWPVISISLSSG